MTRLLTPDEIRHLLETPPGWDLDRDGRSITTDLWFDGFRAAWEFMSSVAQAADTLDHHPEWQNVFDRVQIRLTTHDADGLTTRDQSLAAALTLALPRHYARLPSRNGVLE